MKGDCQWVTPSTDAQMVSGAGTGWMDCKTLITRHDHFLDVGKYLLPSLAIGRCRVRQQVLHVSRLYIGEHWSCSNGLQVICDVVH